MTKGQKTSAQPIKVMPPWKRILLIVGVVIATPLILWGMAEFNYQQRINALKSEVQKVEQDMIKPAGGVALGPGWEVRGPHFLDSLGCIDTGPCPMVNRDWILLVEPGTEASLIKTILNREGYTGGKIGTTNVVSGNQGEGTKDRRDMNLEVQPLGSKQPPYAAPSGKQWIQLYISISDDLPVH